MNKLSSILIILITISVKAQTSKPKIVLNHFLVVVDSTTYQEILKSKILNSNFAYSYEKNKNYNGIYLIGKNNYIEIFNPKSIQNEENNPGTSWICYSSMKVNHLEGLNIVSDKINYSTNDEFDELSLYLQDSSNLITTWEMNKKHYENWSKKTFNDSVNFLSVDYNSPAESDSSRNYLFSDVVGINISVNKADSSNILNYMTILGYSKSEINKNKVRFTNSVDFIDIDFHSDETTARVTTIYMKLKNKNKSERISIGRSEIVIREDLGIWELIK